MEDVRLFIKRLFCRHDYNLKVLMGTPYGSNGRRYRVYKCICSKCGKEEYIKKMW